MWIEINALDTLFFKDSKPFSMGEETWADGIFPPPPSVVYGALRSAYMSQINQNVELANEPADKSKDLVIENYCLSINNTTYYPLPLDLVLEKERSLSDKVREERKNRYKLHALALKENKFQSSFAEISYVLTSDIEVESLNNAYISQVSLEKYLSCSDDSLYAKLIDREVQIEAKVGIGRNSITHTTHDSKLYRVGMRRLNDVVLLVRFRKLDNFSKEGLIKLGGESKAARYQELSDSLEVDQPEQKQKRFKIYLATPALLKNGWIPEWIDPKNLRGIYPGTTTKVQIISAAIGKPIPIGGFDMKNKMPKPMLQAVPAGSVYYFEIVDGHSCIDYDTIKPVKFCDYSEKINEGFGITFKGNVV